MDLTSLSDRIRPHGGAEALVESLRGIHEEARLHLEKSATKYKVATDRHRRELLFDSGDLVWVYLTKDHLPSHEYNKLRSRKIGPVKVLERINDNAYRLELPEHLKTSNVFNLKYLTPYRGANDLQDSEANLLIPPEI